MVCGIHGFEPKSLSYTYCLAVECIWEHRSCWHIAAAFQLLVKCFDFNKIHTMCQRRRKRNLTVSISLLMSFTEGELLWYCGCYIWGKQSSKASGFFGGFVRSGFFLFVYLLVWFCFWVFVFASLSSDSKKRRTWPTSHSLRIKDGIPPQLEVA